ncbi:MAG: bacteriophage abortive infection AbiH family protein [Firmicutes bacterium]|nr:bacteriophage abortive infection AbiH family protein [Bacillota bacterium]
MITQQKKNNLLIIGNGFDLACKLPSSYLDFYTACIKDTLGEPFGLQQTKRGQTFGFWENLLLEYEKKFGAKDYLWCDIEKIIKDTLGTIFLSGDCLLNLALGIQENDSILQLVHIRKYIEEQLKNFFNTNTLKFDRKSIDSAKKAVCAYLLKELNLLESRFCKYLNKQIVAPAEIKNPIRDKNDDYFIRATNLLIKLFGFIIYKKITTNSELRELEKHYFDDKRNSFVLSFNYTPLLDNIPLGKAWHFTNIHGQLCVKSCKNCKKSSIVFGIDNKAVFPEKDSNENEFELSLIKQFSKTYRVLKMQKKQTQILPSSAEPLVIKVFGHSLNEADYSYFQSIFDYYNIYDNSQVSLIFYYSTWCDTEKHDKTEAVYKLINEYGATLTNKDQGKNLMHKLLLENRLSVEQIDTE